MICTLPLIMVVGFLAFTLLVGLYYSRKTTHLMEYAIGHKNFTTLALVSTIHVTTYGGAGLMQNVQEVYCQGLFWALFSLLFSLIAFWQLSLAVIHMGPLMENFSLVETIGKVYEKIRRIITALSSMACLIGFIAIQVTVTAQVLSICDVHVKGIDILSNLILIIYSVIGDIQAVTIIDLFRLIVFVIIIPYLAWLMFIKSNTFVGEIITKLSFFEKFKVNQVFQWHKPLIGILAYQCTYLISRISYQSAMQMVYMFFSVSQARKGFLMLSIVDVFIKRFMLLVGALAFAYDPYLEKVAIWFTITRELVPLFKRFLAISLLAMARSTADACLVMVVHDMVNSLNIAHLNGTYQLRLARITVLLVGLLALLLTVKQKDLLEWFMFCSSLFVPIITTLLLLAIFCFCSSSRTAVVGMAMGAIISFVWKIYLPDVAGSFPARLVNRLTMLLARYGLLKRSKVT